MEQELKLRIVIVEPPPGVDFALQQGRGSKFIAIQRQRSNAQNLHFEFSIKVKGSRNVFPDFHGVCVQGNADSRFVYIDIGTFAGQEDSPWTRRLKIPLQGITIEMIKELQFDANNIIITHVAGTGKDAGPNCGTVNPFNGWFVKHRKKN